MNFCLPNDLSADQFLAEYWQKKPLLIKQGLPQLAGIFEPEDILGLALEEDATARLITQNKVPQGSPPKDFEYIWRVTQSPLNEDIFSELTEKWTVLVQNLEQWSPELGQLWNAFNFIPQWQRDDIMVSYAPKGGSVGKHYDDYDVFLAQGYGRRRWQLGKFCDATTEFIQDQPIRIFDDMGDIIFDEVLAPGDVLYVPPKLAHYGVAEDDCLTFSFGFRRPNLMQILDSVADLSTSEENLFIPLNLEQGIQPSGKLDESSIEQIKAQLLDMLKSEQGDSLIKQAVSEVVSKRQYDLLIPEETIDSHDLEQALADGASLHPDYSSRLIYTELNQGLAVYANGQHLDNIDEREMQLLKRLADGNSLTAQDLFVDTDTLINTQTIMTWLENGWVWLDY